MIPLRSALLIDAPLASVQRALWSPGVWIRAATAAGHRLQVRGMDTPAKERPLRRGDLMRVRRGRLTRWVMLRVGVSAAAEKGISGDVPAPAAGPTLILVAGPLRTLRVSTTCSPTGAGVLVTFETLGEARWPILTPLLRRRILAQEQLLLGVAALACREDPVVVVAGVIIDGDRVLAARRTHPAEAAGFWECPGGKVEPGESEQEALRRELVEELGISTSIEARIGPDIGLAGGMVLHAYLVTAVSGEPTATDHDAIRWVSADELDDFRWLPTDLALLPAIRRALRSGGY